MARGNQGSSNRGSSNRGSTSRSSSSGGSSSGRSSGGSNRGRNNNPSGRNQYSSGVLDLARDRPVAAAAVAAGAAAAGLFLWSRRAQISDQLSSLSEQIGDWTENMRSGDSTLGWSEDDDTAGLTTASGMSETGGGNASLGASSGGGGMASSASGRGRANQSPVG